MLGAALTVAAVVRLSLYARRDEIEIMQLVGAPSAYIRGPFVIEGLLPGRHRRGRRARGALACARAVAVGSASDLAGLAAIGAVDACVPRSSGMSS